MAAKVEVVQSSRLSSSALQSNPIPSFTTAIVEVIPVLLQARATPIWIVVLNSCAESEINVSSLGPA